MTPGFPRRRPGGGTVTVEIQDGSVTAVSRTSITLKSSDGFTRAYAVPASTIVVAQRNGIGSVKVGGQAQVVATASGGTVTTLRVRDLTQLKAEVAPGRFGLWLLPWPPTRLAYHTTAGPPPSPVARPVAEPR